MAKSDKEWAQRTLCSDGNCIGIIGVDGRCKECGLPYEGDLAVASGEEMDGLPTDRSIAGEVHHQADDSAAVADESDDAWENRTLCIDESCIGVVGPDGRCKECGKPHPGKAS
jgi:hypothetical protein